MMMVDGDRDRAIDPKGLIAEAYRIKGIGPQECRSIFLDWALSLPSGENSAEALRILLTRHGARHPGHPMSEILRAGLAEAEAPRRRGGARARRRQ